jgi:small-conductance mechanosensitive channel
VTVLSGSKERLGPVRQPGYGTQALVGTVGWVRQEHESQPEPTSGAAVFQPPDVSPAGAPPKARPRNRPLQAICTLILALAAAVGVHLFGVDLHSHQANLQNEFRVTPDVGHLITVGGAIVFLIFALISTFAFARWARSMLERFIGATYSAIVRYVLILVGIGVVALTTMSMLGFRVAQLVVGGTVLGVLLTIAAQQSLSNLFAGVMLQFAHPFRLGDRIWVRSGTIGGTVVGLVTEFSITYVRIQTDAGHAIYLPNAQVLAAAVSPTAPQDDPDPLTVPVDDPI